MFWMNHPDSFSFHLIYHLDIKPNSQGPSRQLYRGFRVESSRLGIKPCFKVDPNARMWSRAAGKFPVVKKRPRSEMN